MNTRNAGHDFRWQLLTTVSAWVLLVAVYGPIEAHADQDADRPTVWIELGGQLEQMGSSQEVFSPPFMASIAQKNLLSATNVQQPSTFSLGEEGKISFQPDDSDWVFSASILYGRSMLDRHRHQQTANAGVPVKVSLPTFPGKYLKYGTFYPSQHIKFADATAKQTESHAVLDFQVGKDIGIGVFGGHTSSVFSAGIRFAQFDSNANVSMHAEPDVQYPTKPITSVSELLAWNNAVIHFHDFAATADSQRSFRGLGPSVAWNGSMPFAGTSERGELAFDWGANAAILFGRQKAGGHHQTAAKTYNNTNWNNEVGGGVACGCVIRGHFGGGPNYTGGATAHHTNAAGFNRVRSVVVPNLGGFADLSARYSDVRVSLGYRADFFFGAIDGGIDAARMENRGFYGPFVNISVGFP